ACFQISSSSLPSITGGLSNRGILMGFDFSGGKTIAGLRVFESLEEEELPLVCWARAERPHTARATRRRGNFFIQKGLQNRGEVVKLRMLGERSKGTVSYKTEQRRNSSSIRRNSSPRVSSHNC